MEKGDFDAACPALQQSLDLDPALGTTFTLAECERLRGRSASALAHYEQFLAETGRLDARQKRKYAPRVTVANKQRDAMAAIAPRLTLKLTDVATPDVVIRVDDRPLAANEIGIALRFDPGLHTIVVKNDSGTKERSITLADRDEKVVTMPIPEAMPTDAVVEAPPSSGGFEVPASAYVVGSFAVAGLAVGAVGGALALSNRADADAGCDSSKRCTPKGLAAVDDIKTFGAVSTAGFIVGGVGVATTAAILIIHNLTKSPASAESGADVAFAPIIDVSGPRDAWFGVRLSY